MSQTCTTTIQSTCILPTWSEYVDQCGTLIIEMLQRGGKYSVADFQETSTMPFRKNMIRSALYRLLDHGRIQTDYGFYYISEANPASVDLVSIADIRMAIARSCNNSQIPRSFSANGNGLRVKNHFNVLQSP